MTQPVLVVGTGLVGTSVALALGGGRRMRLADADPAHLQEAVDRGAGLPWDGAEPVELVVVATPPEAVPAAVARLQRALPDAPVTHVASIQGGLLDALAAAGVDAARLCGGHPVAGRETAGPQAASADLFAGRPWVLCPTTATRPEVRDRVARLAAECGADPVQLDPREHDRVMALVSHLPHLAASAAAARLLDGPAAAALSGPGLQDTTRVAAGDPQLWSQILLGNAEAVAPVVQALADDLAAAAAALRAGPAGRHALLGLLERGRAGRALVPVKRGDADPQFARVSILLPDTPGQLAGVLTCAAQAGVNVEDVRVEHLPGRPSGVLDLLVAAADQGRVRTALTAAGYAVAGGPAGSR